MEFHTNTHYKKVKITLIFVSIISLSLIGYLLISGFNKENPNTVNTEPIILFENNKKNYIKSVSDKTFNIAKTRSLKEALDINSIAISNFTELNQYTSLINDMKDIAENIEYYKEIDNIKTFSIPKQAYMCELDNMGVYAWQRTYKKYIFDIQYTEKNIALKLGEGIVHVKITQSDSSIFGIEYEILVYQFA
ncbi:hypothetical protein [Clostridium beijerinckii]|nr:hypothetical protein [Clostridium beijerinckii]